MLIQLTLDRADFDTIRTLLAGRQRFADDLLSFIEQLKNIPGEQVWVYDGHWGIALSLTSSAGFLPLVNVYCRRPKEFAVSVVFSERLCDSVYLPVGVEYCGLSLAIAVDIAVKLLKIIRVDPQGLRIADNADVP